MHTLKNLGISAAAGMLLPLLAFAQGVYGDESVGLGSNSGMTFADVVETVIGYINQIIPVLIALAIVYFFVGIIRYIRNRGEHSNRTELLWSLAALFVLFSVWGILNILSNTFLGAPNSTGVNGYFGTTPYENTNSFGGPR